MTAAATRNVRIKGAPETFLRVSQLRRSPGGAEGGRKGGRRAGGGKKKIERNDIGRAGAARSPKRVRNFRDREVRRWAKLEKCLNACNYPRRKYPAESNRFENKFDISYGTPGS